MFNQLYHLLAFTTQVGSSLPCQNNASLTSFLSTSLALPSWSNLLSRCLHSLSLQPPLPTHSRTHLVLIPSVLRLEIGCCWGQPCSHALTVCFDMAPPPRHDSKPFVRSKMLFLICPLYSAKTQHSFYYSFFKTEDFLISFKT